VAKACNGTGPDKKDGIGVGVGVNVGVDVWVGDGVGVMVHVGEAVGVLVGNCVAVGGSGVDEDTSLTGATSVEPHPDNSNISTSKAKQITLGTGTIESICFLVMIFSLNRISR
jgi:hypothetical protein